MLPEFKEMSTRSEKKEKRKRNIDELDSVE